MGSLDSFLFLVFDLFDMLSLSLQLLYSLAMETEVQVCMYMYHSSSGNNIYSCYVRIASRIMTISCSLFASSREAHITMSEGAPAVSTSPRRPQRRASSGGGVASLFTLYGRPFCDEFNVDG